MGISLACTLFLSPSLILALSLDAHGVNQKEVPRKSQGPMLLWPHLYSCPAILVCVGRTLPLPTAPLSEWLGVGWQGQAQNSLLTRALHLFVLSWHQEGVSQVPSAEVSTLDWLCSSWTPQSPESLQTGKHGDENQLPCYLASAGDNLTEDQLSPTALGGLPLHSLFPPW